MDRKNNGISVTNASLSVLLSLTIISFFLTIIYSFYGGISNAIFIFIYGTQGIFLVFTIPLVILFIYQIDRVLTEENFKKIIRRIFFTYALIIYLIYVIVVCIFVVFDPIGIVINLLLLIVVFYIILPRLVLYVHIKINKISYFLEKLNVNDIEKYSNNKICKRFILFSYESLSLFICFQVFIFIFMNSFKIGFNLIEGDFDKSFADEFFSVEYFFEITKLLLPLFPLSFILNFLNIKWKKTTFFYKIYVFIITVRFIGGMIPLMIFPISPTFILMLWNVYFVIVLIFISGFKLYETIVNLLVYFKYSMGLVVLIWSVLIGMLLI